MSGNDIFFEPAAIIAGMGDVHTAVHMPESLYEYWFPFGVVHCGGKLYLPFYLEGYEQFEPHLLREIAAVNGVDISYLERKFESLTGLNNTWYEWENTILPDVYIHQSIEDIRQGKNSALGWVLAQ